MQSIGERLEEARKRRGISIREASEATKIRGDFLLSFENNQFDIGLPEIYARGFVRNYAQFLKIEADKLITDLTSKLIADSKSARKESRELFGRMELPERPRQAPERERAGGGDTHARPADEGGPRRGVSPEMSNYLKIAGIIAAGIIVILIIVWLVKAIIGAASSGDANAATSSAAVQQIPTETITLIALGRVEVRVDRVSDDYRYFTGVMAQGETETLEVQGSVYIYYDNGPNLNLEWGDQRYAMTSDYGRTLFPPAR